MLLVEVELAAAEVDRLIDHHWPPKISPATPAGWFTQRSPSRMSSASSRSSGRGPVRAVHAIPPEARRARPSPQVWSVTEYVCHLRDVYMTYHPAVPRPRTEDRPVLEPVFTELRARRFRYDECDMAATLNELAVAVAGFCVEIARTGERDWDRVATRLPAEQRTARWLVRQAMRRRCSPPRRCPQNRQHIRRNVPTAAAAS